MAFIGQSFLSGGMMKKKNIYVRRTYESNRLSKDYLADAYKKVSRKQYKQIETNKKLIVTLEEN